MPLCIHAALFIYYHLHGRRKAEAHQGSAWKIPPAPGCFEGKDEQEMPISTLQEAWADDCVESEQTAAL